MQPLVLQVGRIEGHRHPTEDGTNILSEGDERHTVLGQKLQVRILNGCPEQ